VRDGSDAKAMEFTGSPRDVAVFRGQPRLLSGGAECAAAYRGPLDPLLGLGFLLFSTPRHSGRRACPRSTFNFAMSRRPIACSFPIERPLAAASSA
jgi:hypothetical protein